MRALTPPKLGGDVDTMSPDQHAKGKCRNPFRLPDFVSGIHARGTREIVMSRTSPRILLLHLPPTDPLRRIHSLADSRGGTSESPAGRSFDPSAEGAMTTARPPLLLLICLCFSLLSTDYGLSPCCHTLCRCSLIVRTLRLRREKWYHYPPTVTTRKSY